MCGMSIVSVKQSLMNGVAVVHRISCTAIEPRHGQGGTAQQATQDFVFESFARQIGISVHPTERVVKLSSDQEVVAKGEANVYMRLGSVQQAIKCAVMPLLFGVDVILGQQFMTSHKCILDFDRMCVLLRKGRRRVSVLKSDMPRQKPPLENKHVSSLSAMQVKRIFLKRQPVFLAVIKPLDVLDDSSRPSPLSASSGSTPSKVNYDLKEPSDREAWKSGLVAEFADVFKDLLSIGLPPERQEGHSISTEPGHSPPFKPMYRLSPLEYKEL
jgi:hypothetical protein